MRIDPRIARPLIFTASLGVPVALLAQIQSQNTSETPLGGAVKPLPSGLVRDEAVSEGNNAPSEEGETREVDEAGITTADFNSEQVQVVPVQFSKGPATPQPLKVAGQPVRVGLSTAGGAIAVYLPGGAILTDAEQGGRAFRVAAGKTLTFNFGQMAEVPFGGKKFRGPIAIKTPLGLSRGWQHVQIQVLGTDQARVTSNGTDARWGRPYRGHLEVFAQRAPEPTRRKGPLAIVNVAALEEYLKGVVPWEMSPSAPTEALRAQAICARTKALQQIASKRFASGGFDVCDYDACQGYPGTENEKPSTTQAVEATRGMALYNRGKVIDAVFCTNSGGITAAARDVWNSTSDTPYLKSVRDIDAKSPTAAILKPNMTEADWAAYITRPWPTYARPDEAARDALAARRARLPAVAAIYGPDDWPEFYRWSRSIPSVDVNTAFANRGFARVTNFEIVQRTTSGRIRRLKVVGEKLGADGKTAPHNLMLDGDGQIRAMFSGRLGSTTALPSSMFVVTPQTDAAGQISGWSLQGSGWGHGVGMCQRGAQNRAKAGWDARRILNFYYNDIEIRKVAT